MGKFTFKLSPSGDKEIKTVKASHEIVEKPKKMGRPKKDGKRYALHLVVSEETRQILDEVSSCRTMYKYVEDAVKFYYDNGYR